MTEPGAVGVNAIGVLFFVIAAYVSRYTPRHGSDMSEFWIGLGPAMYVGALYAMVRTVQAFDVLPELVALLEMLLSVVAAAVFMVVGIVWSVKASRQERLLRSWGTSKENGDRGEQREQD